MFAGTVTKWVQTAPTDLVTGDVVAIVDKTNTKAMENTGAGYKNSPAQVAVTLNTDKDEITSTVAGTLQWVVTKSGDSFQFQADSEKYLYVTADNNGLRVGTGARNTFTIVTGGENNGYYLYNSADDDNRYVGAYQDSNWRCYTSINSNIKGNNNAFYKKVVTESATAPEAPTFAPAAGTYYTSQEIQISCATDGAEIYYSTNGEDYDKYTSSFPVTSTKTVYAYASKDGENSSTVSATYVIGESYDNFGDMQTAVAADGFTNTAIRYRATGGMYVAFINGSNAYLIDGEGNGMLVYDNTSVKNLTVGQKMSYDDGYLTATLTKYRGNSELTNVTFPVMTGGTVTVTPAEKTLPLTSANQSTLVTIKGLTYNASESTFSDGTNTIAYYDSFSATPTLVDGKTYDVTGIVVMFNDKIEICPRTAEDVVEAAAETTLEFNEIKLDLTEQGALTAEEYASSENITVKLLINSEGEITRKDDATNPNVTITGHPFQGDKRHGWNPFTMVAPVKGKVKITIGGCQYNGNSNKLTVTPEGGEAFTVEAPAACYHSDKDNNLKSAYYDFGEDLVNVTFVGPQYTPYIAVEPVAEIPSNYTITYVPGDGTGTVPEEVEIAVGESITLPYNYTLYKEDYTQTGWSSSEDTYALGETITPEADMTMSAVFTENEVSLADRTEAVTVTFKLDGTAGKFNINNSGIVVTQATVNDKTIDVPMKVTAGTLATNNDWHQVKNSFKATVPSAKGATFAINTYDDPTSLLSFGGSTTFDVTGSGHSWTATYTATTDASTIEIAQSGSTYWKNLTITLPVVEQGGEEPAATDVTATWDFKNVNPSTLSTLSIQKDQTGTVASNVEGIELNVIANEGKLQQRTSDAQFNNGTVIQVPVKNKGDQVVVVSYPNYHYYTIGGINAAADTETYEAKQSDATKGYVEIVSTGSAYLYSITVTQYAPKEATTLDNESATATFPFNLGTAGQTATFTNADYWLNSKVSWGSNFTVNGTRNVSDFTETQLKTTAKEAAADESNLIKFTITPKPGFTFTPTKVTFTATRVGTDGGKLDVAWYNSNKTSASLETGFTPNRENNAAQPYSTKTYDLTTNTDVVAGEGECGLQFNLYNLDAGKNYGFVNIIIEGTLSGTEKELPILASFKANDTEYTVDDVFGDLYEATLELSKSESMISESNPLTEITATSGEVGTVTYTDATETGCKVTIPVTAGETTLEYILNITQKPDFTLTYIGVDGTTVLNTQTVEKDATIGTFAQDIADVAASKDGYKARGWFKNNYVGEKWATTDVVTADAKLYAVETEIEVSSDSKKYVFDLTDKFFDPADHEAFNPTGGKPNVSDMRHGWAFANGNTIDLLVGPKASIIISTCQYPTNGTTKITASNGQSIDAVSATDGATATIEYEGEAGTLTLSFDGSAYIHKLTILNTAETNYEKDGNWIIAKAGDASSFLDAIDAANGTSGEDPVYIFLPNGTYDLAQTTKTNIGRSNVSIIGESMEGVIIKNRPVKEGIDITATLFNTSENLYMQDLTLDCVAPYGTGDDTSSAERGVTLQDKGTQTILKNVYLKGRQDTYYCNNNNGQYYFEDGKIEGTVDYICGNGDAYFNKVTLFNTDHHDPSTGDCITAPNTPKQYGYIFNECTIDGVSAQDGKYALGRPWASNTQVIFLNTTMKIQPKAEGWSEWSNDVAKQNSVKQFAEYNSVDANDNAIDLTGRKKTFKGVTNVPTLNETQAAAFALENVFAGWNPAQYTEQVKTTSAKLNGNTLTWAAVDGATMYAIVKNGSIIDLTDQTSYTIADEAQGAKGLGTATEDPTAAGDTYAVRAANGRGGFGEAVVADDATGIDNITTDATGINGTITEVYSMGGARLAAPQKGVNIVKVKANDGSVKTVKVVIK